MSIKVYCYKEGSKGAKRLSQALDAKRIKHHKSKYKGRKKDIVINWGAAGIPIPETNVLKILNHPSAVQDAQDKLRTFRVLELYEIPIPPFTESHGEALQWVKELKKGKGIGVLARTALRASEGRGIHPLSFGSEVPPAPLYVKYIKKDKEFRVHVFRDQVIDVQQKRRDLDTPKEEVDFQIRNHKNGWVFTRQNVEEPEGLREIAVEAVSVLNLDFGAVDIIWNRKQNKCFVLEVNTAPGLEGETVNKYAETIKKFVEANHV